MPRKSGKGKVKILPLEADYDESKLYFIKHSRKVTNADGSVDYTEMSIPRLEEEATATQIVDFLTEFTEARTTLRWTTGPKLFEKFRMHLRGDAKDIWQEAVDNNAPTETPAETA